MLKRLAIALGVFSLAAGAVPAFATTFDVVGQGLVAPNANYGCPLGSGDCLVSMDFQLSGTAAATGSISLNSAGTLATISLDVASSTFTPVPGPGAADVFTGAHYSATVSVVSSATFISQLTPSTGAVTGLLNGLPFSTSATAANLSCVFSAGTGQCGVAFGPNLFAAGSQNWLHTFNVTVATPEPSALALLLLGLAGLALRRR